MNLLSQAKVPFQAGRIAARPRMAQAGGLVSSGPAAVPSQARWEKRARCKTA